MTTCEVPAADPIPSAVQACAALVSRLPLEQARARRGTIARAWSTSVVWLRARRMPRAGVRRDARLEPADARAAVAHYLATHWVNR